MKKSLGLMFLLTLSIPVSTPALAQVNLKSVDTTDGERIRLQFDRELTSKQIKTEYIRDIIQVSISDATVYPAKIAAIENSPFKKVFTYQYTPKLVRCRINVGGKAESYKNRVTVTASGKTLIISTRKGEIASDSIQVASAQAKEPPRPANLSADEEELLQKVKKKQDPGAHFEKNKGETSRLTSGKEPPSPMKSFGYLGVIIALLYVGFHMIRRGKKSAANVGGSQGKKSTVMGELMGAFSNIVKKSVNRSSTMIEMVDTFTIDPKKSISIVRVKGRNLVLGVSDQSVNLITELGSERTIETKSPDEEAIMRETDQFEKELEAIKKEQGNSRSSASVRERIRERVGGMKNL